MKHWSWDMPIDIQQAIYDMEYHGAKMDAPQYIPAGGTAAGDYIGHLPLMIEREPFGGWYKNAFEKIRHDWLKLTNVDICPGFMND